MPISKLHFQAVQAALQKLSFQVRLTGAWSELHRELGVGEIQGKKLILTRADHAALREWMRNEFGADPLVDVISGDRLEAAAANRDEKWATKPVFSGMVQVSRRDGDIPCTGVDARTPPGTLLSISYEYLDVVRIQDVVVVENGIIAREWHTCPVPPEITRALMLYRGHGFEAEAAQNWFAQLPGSVRKIGYFDLDPAGLGMAMDMGLDAILIPKDLTDELTEGRNNKPDSFTDQIMRRPDLGKQLPATLQPLWSWMTAGNRRCAVTQERLAILGVQLQLLNIRP